VLIFDFIDQISNPLLDSIFSVITASYLLIPLLVIVLFYMHLKKDNKKNPEIIKSVLPIILAVLLTALLTTGIKEIIHEDRPCNVMNVHYITCEESKAFPSRHTAIAFSTIPFLLFNRKFFIILFLYACLVGMGMIYLGLHYPHDVLVGMIIGYLIGVLFMVKGKFIMDKLFQTNNK